MDASPLLADCRLLPVVVIDAAEPAVALARTLRDAGVGAIEITLRTEAALAAIEAVAREVPEILLGAGSVRAVPQFRQVIDAGACFAVSPGATPMLLGEASLPLIPGGATATEFLIAFEAGYRLQKFFPAQLSGGAAMLRAISQPLPEVRFCPTGGVTPDNARDYLSLPSVACIGGSWFVPPSALAERDFDTIGRLAREAVALTTAVG
ncbi:MAG: bifunctional 4-hydroxy-2-oxoglutarate aldolase/2-dehydro-3-deoxy-phosphogluconate aldolase [Pseudomonadota bacterium]